MKRTFGIDEPREYSRKQKRTDDERDRAKALNRALQFALLALAHAMGHHTLRGRKRNVPHRDDWDRRDVNQAGSGDTGNHHSHRAKELADVKRAPFTKPSHDAPGESAGNCGRENTHDSERNTDHGLAPKITIDRVQRPDHEYFV